MTDSIGQRKGVLTPSLTEFMHFNLLGLGHFSGLGPTSLGTLFFTNLAPDRGPIQENLLMLKRMWKHELCLKCLTIMAPAILAQALLLGSLNPTCVKKIEGKHFRTNPEPAMASSATSATSFELIEDQALTAEEVEMASQEAQEVRTREAAVAAGLVLDEPEAPPSASATDVMNDLSSALERLRVAFSTDSRPGCPWPRRGRGQGDGRCGHHGAGYSTNEEAEGLRGEQTGLAGAGGWPSWLFQASGPPRPLPGPSGIHVAEGRHGGAPCSTSLSVRISRRTWWFASWGLCSDEDPDPARGGLGLTVPAE